MGLGLYLASSFIESLGGELLIESSRGRGSTVSIRIPLGRGAREWVRRPRGGAQLASRQTSRPHT